MTRPGLIVVSGPPGCGKTTLANALARAVRCPAICRDELREGLVNTHGGDFPAPGDDIARRANHTFFETIELLVKRDTTIIVEAAFGYKLWAAGLEPLIEIAGLRIIQCRLPLELLRERYRRRLDTDVARRNFHPDRAFLAELEKGNISMDWYDMTPLGCPALTVDTSDGYNPALEEVADFARSR